MPRPRVSGTGDKYCARWNFLNSEIDLLMSVGIVHEITGNRQNSLFAYSKYLALLDKGVELLALGKSDWRREMELRNGKKWSQKKWSQSRFLATIAAPLS